MVVNVNEAWIKSMVDKNPQVRILKRVLDQAKGNDEAYNFLEKELESLIEEKKKGYIIRATKAEIVDRMVKMFDKDKDVLAFDQKDSSFTIETETGEFKVRIKTEKVF